MFDNIDLLKAWTVVCEDAYLREATKQIGSLSLSKELKYINEVCIELGVL